MKAAESLRDLDIPLVALVRGNCYGSALNLMLMADVRVAADDADVLRASGQARARLPRHLLEPLVDTVGRSAASELILTARVIGAEGALDASTASLQPVHKSTLYAVECTGAFARIRFMHRSRRTTRRPRPRRPRRRSRRWRRSSNERPKR